MPKHTVSNYIPLYYKHNCHDTNFVFIGGTKAVIMTTWDAAIDNKVGIMTTLFSPQDKPYSEREMWTSFTLEKLDPSCLIQVIKFCWQK